jgi:hypothetical protein
VLVCGWSINQKQRTIWEQVFQPYHSNTFDKSMSKIQMVDLSDVKVEALKKTL